MMTGDDDDDDYYPPHANPTRQRRRPTTDHIRGPHDQHMTAMATGDHRINIGYNHAIYYCSMNIRQSVR